jgi:hypothetical protein
MTPDRAIYVWRFISPKLWQGPSIDEWGKKCNEIRTR